MMVRCRILVLVFVLLVLSSQSLRPHCHQSRAPTRTSPLFGLHTDELEPRSSVLLEIADSPGALYTLLGSFAAHEVQLTSIESRPSPATINIINIYLSFGGKIGETRVDSLLADLGKTCKNMLVLGDKQVPWFPNHISDLDKIATRCVDLSGEKSGLSSDHPGFRDVKYRERRKELAQLAMDYRWDEPVPRVAYTQDEIITWSIVYEKLMSLQSQFACHEYNNIMPLMQRHCGYSSSSIPQAADISAFLMERTGFRLRPVPGLLSSRDFLNGLAFRVFFSTQYMRHGSKPLYTPEPDLCHELLGHAPMFALPDFASFSQEIGLASLGASDELIERLANCYWHSVEFGLVLQHEKDQGGLGTVVKAYGAGLLSSFGEIEHAVGGGTRNHNDHDGSDNKRPQLLPWDPQTASQTKYPITSYQPTYFVAESLKDAEIKMRKWCQDLPKPFHARYNHNTQTVWVDRAVQRSSVV